MTKCKYDIKRVPRELLEAYFEKANFFWGSEEDDKHLIDEYCAIRRAARIPLKSRDQVNKELGEMVRAYVQQQNGSKTSDYNYHLSYDGMVAGTKLFFAERVREILGQPTEE